MSVPEIVESFTSSVNRVTLGATKQDGGTRTSTVTVGGARNVVYGGSIEEAGQKPVVALDVLDGNAGENRGVSGKDLDNGLPLDIAGLLFCRFCESECHSRVSPSPVPRTLSQ